MLFKNIYNYYYKMIELRNSKIISFFNDNPNINPETLFINLIDIYTYIKKTVTSSNNEQLLPYILENNSKLDNIFNTINNNDNNLQRIIDNNIDNIKNIIIESKNKTIDEILSMLKNNNEIIYKNLISKIETILNDSLDIETLINQLNNKLEKINTKLSSEEQNKYLNSIYKFLIENKEKTNKELLDYIKDNNELIYKTFDNSLLNKFHNNLIPRIEDIINRNNIDKLNLEFVKYFNEINSKNIILETQMNKVSSKLEDINNKFNGSSNKGIIGENVMYRILNKLFPSYEIINSTKDGHKGDFIIKYEINDILIETKNYNNNVSTKEVKKFERDCFDNNIPGIFLSQNSGIANKKNFQIDIDNNNNILLYVHEVNYNEDIVKLSIDIIYHYNKLIKDNKIDKNVIKKEDFEKIKKEYENFLIRKHENIKYFESFTNDFKKKLYNIDIPLLGSIFNNSISLNEHEDYILCECGFKAKNKKGLALHKRHCKYNT